MKNLEFKSDDNIVPFTQAMVISVDAGKMARTVAMLESTVILMFLLKTLFTSLFMA